MFVLSLSLAFARDVSAVPTKSTQTANPSSRLRNPDDCTDVNRDSLGHVDEDAIFPMIIPLICLASKPAKCRRKQLTRMCISAIASLDSTALPTFSSRSKMHLRVHSLERSPTCLVVKPSGKHVYQPALTEAPYTAPRGPTGKIRQMNCTKQQNVCWKRTVRSYVCICCYAVLFAAGRTTTPP